MSPSPPPMTIHERVSAVLKRQKPDRLPFIDLNYEAGYTVANAGRYSRLTSLTLPVCLTEADWIVSLAKLKTHHWAGVTLAMKNLFDIATVRGKIQVFDNLYQKLVKALENEYGPRS